MKFIKLAVSFLIVYAGVLTIVTSIALSAGVDFKEVYETRRLLYLVCGTIAYPTMLFVKQE